MLRSVEQILQHIIQELDTYGYTTISDETTACNEEPYSIRQIHASKARPQTSPIENVVISGRMRNGECIALHSASFGPSESHLEMHTWCLEAEGPIQHVSYYANPLRYPVALRNLTLAFLSREQLTGGQPIRIYRANSYHDEGGQFKLDPHLGTRASCTSKGVVQKIYVPKTIALEPWIEHFSDTGGQILKNPSHPWQNWFRKLGVGHVQK